MKNLRTGSHIKASRLLGAYTHHGIYIGEGKVIHYAGLSNGCTKGAIEVTTIDEFLDEAGTFQVISYLVPQAHSPEEIVARAKSRIGEDSYNLIFNNCEHFACWCVTGEADSTQVRSVMSNTTTAVLSYTLVQQGMQIYAKEAPRVLTTAITASAVPVLASSAATSVSSVLTAGAIGGLTVATATATGLVAVGSTVAAPVVITGVILGSLLGALFE